MRVSVRPVFTFFQCFPKSTDLRTPLEAALLLPPVYTTSWLALAATTGWRVPDSPPSGVIESPMFVGPTTSQGVPVWGGGGVGGRGGGGGGGGGGGAFGLGCQGRYVPRAEEARRVQQV